jgi:hypothetical protein
MPQNQKNLAVVEQDLSARPPTLTAGDITPAVMRDFEDSCVGYFDNKDIKDVKQVKKILSCFRDMRVKDWIASDKARIQSLSFTEFMEEFRAAYLDADWEETTHRELGAMMQGKELSFWDFAISVQAQNSLLASTPSHLNKDQLRHRLEVGMEEMLAKRCMNMKVNKILKLKDWLGEVKCQDDLMRAEQSQFEEIMKAGRGYAQKSNVLGEPSHRANTGGPSRGAAPSGN